MLTRRHYTRFDVDAHAVLILENNIKKALRLKNISTEGLCGINDNYVAPGNKVEVILMYPFFTDAVKRQAEVAWCSKIDETRHALGLNFRLNKIELTEFAKNRRAS